MYPSIESSVTDIFKEPWAITDGRVVPKTDDVVMKNGGRRVDATYLYADLAGSSKMANSLHKETTAKIIRAYINTASRILRNFGGEIRSFDGDRVMAIFMGVDKETKAVRAALAINWAVFEVLRPKIKESWSDGEKFANICHGIGIDTGEALIVRGGVRDRNDLISIGKAPNRAAKLSEIRDAYQLTITSEVYEAMDNEVAFTEEGKKLWTQVYNRNDSGVNERVFRSHAYWGV
ncbi:adenylate/guanylate cyclase domain-containing protein [Arthrobacter sp. CAN_C5]|uniref:adenylate/guanylate cyclase domain-containing protein n=1 Tax=Arthrobacter sp. CAN_C5 TaxID=2760706 RepID=UPI001AE63227|nr:adenylate/guanylate cyclase domain-containing protein [Arthrobacter sp. CAN_C5]MBP2215117.1 class 3 adenylate cyclase [Arthrobacter sp. CAN_C5]